MPTLAPVPSTVVPDVKDSEIFVTEEHFTDKWVYLVEEDTTSLCLEHEGQDVDIIFIRFGLQPGSQLVQWSDRLPLSLVKMDAGPDEVMQYWFSKVPDSGPDAEPVNPNVIVPSEFSYDGETYKVVVALTAMRESINQGDVVLMVHGLVAGKSQFLRFIIVPYCQYFG